MIRVLPFSTRLIPHDRLLLQFSSSLEYGRTVHEASEGALPILIFGSESSPV